MHFKKKQNFLDIEQDISKVDYDFFFFFKGKVTIFSS